MWPPQNGNWPMNYMTGGPINCNDLDTLYYIHTCISSILLYYDLKKYNSRLVYSLLRTNT